VQARSFAIGPINVNMIDSEYNAPASEKTLYLNEFVVKPYKEHLKDMETVPKHPKVHDTTELISADTYDVHGATTGVGYWRAVHYDIAREPTFPRKPDTSKGELVAGAMLTRTDSWYDPKEPAITSVARYDPHNIRPVNFAESAHVPATCNVEEGLDFRQNRLPIGHADRRGFIYFCAGLNAAMWLLMTRTAVTKAVHGLWPSKNVFAAGVIEVDLRQIQLGQNFVAKWRSKPVFIRRRTEEMIALARKDDVIAPSMREPATDAQRCEKPEWLICIGVCTHLGCIPQPDAGLFGGYFCPCHGSHYDHAGRIRLGPAPKNLELPPSTFIDEFTIKLG